MCSCKSKVRIFLIDGKFSLLQVSVAMMAKGFMSQMTLVTKEIVAQGRVDAGASISGEMLKNGNLEFVKIWNEARKADKGELEKDPRSVKDQLKDAVGSVTGNAKGKSPLLWFQSAALYDVPPKWGMLACVVCYFQELLKPSPYCYKLYCAHISSSERETTSV